MFLFHELNFEFSISFSIDLTGDVFLLDIELGRVVLKGQETVEEFNSVFEI